MKVLVKREVKVVKFKGILWECVAVGSRNRLRVMSSLRSGLLDHIGSCPDLWGRHSVPQVYSMDSWDGTLLAGAVSSNSSHIDLAWWLTPIRSEYISNE